MFSPSLRKFPLLLCLAAALAGCNKPHNYRVEGRVVATDKPNSELTVDAKAIPNFMPAMAMPYKVKDPRVLDELQPGDAISAQLVVPANHSGAWLQDVVITDEGKPRPAAQAADPVFLQPGDAVPDVPMVNQDGKPIRFSDFRGEALLITFIYTRCPMADYCPRISGQMESLHKDLALSAGDYSKTHLLSITLDPAYDTPPVLRAYGLGYMHDPAGFRHWDFAQATPENLARLAQIFGLDFGERDGQIIHSMVTVLIGPNGVLASRWDGNQWKVADLLTAMKKVAES